MSWYFVAPGPDLSIEVTVPESLEVALAVQWERLKDRASRDAFTRRVSQQLETILPDAIDWDIKEPTKAQVSFAMVLSKSLDVPIPADALRTRGGMHQFLEHYAPIEKERRAKQTNQGDSSSQSS